METMKRKWGKPVTLAQQFVPQEFIAQCDDPGKYYITTPDIENGLADGWQRTGPKMDTFFKNHWRLYFDEYTYVGFVGPDVYPEDQETTYVEIILGSSGGKLVWTGIDNPQDYQYYPDAYGGGYIKDFAMTYPAGTHVYRGGTLGLTIDQTQGGKNFS